jgi:hypothetical protein
MVAARPVGRITKTFLFAQDSYRLSCFSFEIMPARRVTVAFAA